MAWSSCQWRPNCLVDADCRWLMSVRLVLRVIILFLRVGLPSNCLIPPTPPHTLSHWGIRLPAYSIWGSTHSVLNAERLNCLSQRHSPHAQGWRHSGVQCSRDESPSRLSKSKSWLIESGAPDFPSLSWGQVFSFSPLVGKFEPETPLFESAFSCSGPEGHFLQDFYLYRNYQGHVRTPAHYLYPRFLFGFYSCIKIFKMI